MEIFISVGTGLSSTQEKFLQALENRLLVEGLTPCTIGRNKFGSGPPLKTITEAMDKCAGCIVLALERLYFPCGVERPGTKNEKELGEVYLPTSWNQVEAAMAYCRSQPLLVLIARGVRMDGLLEPGHDWYVQCIEVSPRFLNSNEFNGIFADWKKRVSTNSATEPRTLVHSASAMSISQLLKTLKPGELWKVAAAIVTVVVGAFAAGGLLK